MPPLKVPQKIKNEFSCSLLLHLKVITSLLTRKRVKLWVLVPIIKTPFFKCYDGLEQLHRTKRVFFVYNTLFPPA